MIAFLGLSWDPACLDFHRTDRPVRTASVNQVRQTIYAPPSVAGAPTPNSSRRCSERWASRRLKRMTPLWPQPDATPLQPTACRSRHSRQAAEQIVFGLTQLGRHCERE